MVPLESRKGAVRLSRGGGSPATTNSSRRGKGIFMRQNRLIAAFATALVAVIGIMGVLVNPDPRGMQRPLTT